MHPREYRERAVELRNEGLTCPEIGERLGVHARTVQRWLEPSKFELTREQKDHANARVRRRRALELGNSAPDDIPGVLWVFGRGGLVVAATIVDLEDWRRFKHVRLNRASNAYIVGRYLGRDEYLHRLIMGLQPGDGWTVDHINRNHYDNRRCNLRVVSQVENCANRGGRFASVA